MVRARFLRPTSLHLTVGWCLLVLFSSHVARAEEQPPADGTVVFEGDIVDSVLLGSVEGVTVRAFSPERVPLKVETTKDERGPLRMTLTLPGKRPAWVVLEFSAPSYFRIARKERIPTEVKDLGQIRLTRIQSVAMGRTTLSEPPHSDKLFLDTSLKNLSDTRIDIQQLVLTYVFIGALTDAGAETTFVLTYPIDDTIELEALPAGSPDAAPLGVRVSGQFVYHKQSLSSAEEERPYSLRLDIPVLKSLEAKQVWDVRLLIPKRLTVHTAKGTDKKVFLGRDYGATLWVQRATGEMVRTRVPLSPDRTETR